MPCKLYQEVAKEHKDIKDLDKLYREMRELEFADKADLYEETKVDVLDILNTGRPRYRGARIIFNSIAPNDGTFDITYSYLKSPEKSYKINVGGYGQFEFDDERTRFSLTADKLTQLYSDYDFIREGEIGYQDRVIDVINNPEQILEIAEEIAGLDEVTIAEWHKNELMGSLRDITTVFRDALPEITVKLNTEGNKNGGFIRYEGSKASVYTSIGADNRNKSALEVYTHEMIHAITKFAIESRDPKLAEVIRGIKGIKNQFLDEVTAEQLAEMMPDQRMAMKDAESMLKYFSDEKVGLHEFVAYARTNPYVMAKLANMQPKKKDEEHPDLASKFVGYIRDMYNQIVNYVKRVPKSATAYESMMNLTAELAKANNRAQEAKRTGVISGIFDMFSKVESNVIDAMEKQAKKFTDTELPQLKNKTRWGSATYIAKIAARALVDEKAKERLQVAASFMGLKPEGTIQTIFRDMAESDTFQDIAERLGLLSQKIDQQREFEYLGVAGQLKNAFSRKLEDGELETLTATILDTDISTIWHDYKDNMQELLQDEVKLTGEIRKLENSLKEKTDKKSYNFYRDQASGLGYFMVTGKGHLGQMLNAHNIAMKLNTGIEDRNVKNDIVKDIDVLATLYALKNTSAESKQTLANLNTSENNGVEMLVAYQLAHKAKVEEELFSTASDKFKMIKGYSKETFDKDVDFQIAPAADEAKMRRLGYKKLDRELGKHVSDKNPIKMAMYVSTLQVKQDLHRVALRYTDTGRRGTTVRESYAIGGYEFASVAAERDITRMKLDMAKIHSAQMQGKYESNPEDYGIVPTLDNLGRVADYRYMMSKEDKVDVLKMERRAFHIMGRTYASTYDKKESIKFNEMLMEEIDKDASENANSDEIIGKNNKEYITIAGESSNDEVKDIWSVLPDNLKKKYPGGFTVRRDLMHSLLGYRETSIAEMAGFNNLGETARHTLRVAEKIWKEIVKIAKVDIILRVPTVLLGNITSNLMYSVTSGYSPFEIAKLQLQGVKELNEFVRINKEITDLNNLINAGRAPKGSDSKLSALKNDLESNSAKDLVDEGFYMSIVEELGLEEFNTAGRVSEFVDSKLSGFPEFVRNGAHLLYLTDKTKVFKTMNMATQYSDFVARYAQYHLMVRKGMDKDAAVKTVRDAFINYNKPNSKLVEWANQMGFVMFTKYFTRIQKAIKEQGRKNPLKVLFALLGQEFVIGDVEDIYDQSVFTKNVGNMLYNPLDNLVRAVTPSGAEAIQYTWSKL